MNKTLYTKTHQYRCMQVAKRLGITENLAQRVINEYIDSIEEDLLNGERAVIKGIVSMSPVISAEGANIYARTSEAIKEKVSNIDDYKLKFFEEAIDLG